MVALCAVVGAAIAYVHASSKHVEYQAAAQLQFGSNAGVFNVLGLTNTSGDGLVTTQATNAGLVGLPIIATQTKQALGSHVPRGGINVSAQAVGSTNFVEAVAQSPTPSAAITVANAYANQYVLYAEQQQQLAFSQAIGRLTAKVSARRARNQGVALMETTLASLENAAAVNPVGVSVAQPASSASVVSTKTKTKAVEGLVLGAIVGIIVALLLDWLDPKLREVKDEEFHGLRVINLAGLPTRAGPEATTAITRRIFSEGARQGDVPPQLIAITATGNAQDVQAARQLAAALAQTAAANGLSAGIVRVAKADGSSAGEPDDEFAADVTRTKLADGVQAIDVSPRALLQGTPARDLEAELRDSYRVIIVIDERPSEFSALGQLVRAADVSALVVTLARTTRRDAVSAAHELAHMGCPNAVLVVFPAGFRAALQKGLALQPAS